MAAIDSLIDQVEDEWLRARLREEADDLIQKRSYGLVFQRHLPEVTPIYRARPRRGDAVAVRGELLEDLWRVQRIQHGQAICQHLTRGNVHAWPLEQLLVVRRFGEPIFPALTPMDRVANGSADAPWHTLIEADNYHALQLLEYLYAGQVDCIYIDPPYNSGARDWKYNNDYVDKNDSWRHSKWLAMMHRRLLLAKRLLRPENAVLFITIDDNEINSLGMLLEQIFPECEQQMVSITISPRGKSRDKRLSQVDEYLIIVYLGSAGITNPGGDGYDSEVRWRYLRRNDIESARGTAKGGPNQFYPIFVDPLTQRIARIGAPLAPHQALEEAPYVQGTVPVFPIREDGTHMNWGITGPSLQRALDDGYVRVTAGAHPGQPYTFAYLTAPNIEKVNSGVYEVTGRRPDGSSIVVIPGGREARPTSAWRRTQHDAGAYGTSLLRSVLPDRNFPFPKSLYAVTDTLRLFVKDKPDALIVDFFAGSGTTLHAVNLLNVLDGGRRRCIMVTNNEVGAESANTLSRQGHQPGEEEWERHGICQSVTWPRTKYTILGRRDDGTQLEGEYSTGQTREVEKPRRFRHINFVTGAQLATLAQRKQFLSLVEGLPQTLASADLAHVLSEEHTISVLFDEAQTETWLEALDGQDHITEFIIVAPTRPRFNEIKAQVEALLGPAVVSEELKRPMREGFPANVEYFRLDFLDPEQVALKRQFREVLPLLWMRAGCYGPRPVLAAQAPLPAWLLPEANRFAVLLEEECFRDFLPLAHERADLTHVFLVTDAEEAFQEMAAELPPGVLAVQLYRDYLENFLINRGERA